MGVEEIVKIAGRMKEMLRSVYDYNSGFLLDEKQQKSLEKILFAMTIIDRKFFYSGDEVYWDSALPIEEGQTISQPSTVARMLLLSELEEGDDVLEIGTGSGWNASLIAFLVYPGNIIGVELLAKLKEKAEKNLASLKSYLNQKKPQDFVKLGKINFHAENIFEKGKAWKKRYDKIIITAGIKKGEERKIEMLAENLLKNNGLLICPYTLGPLIIYKKNGKLKKFFTKEEYVFVPLLDS
jgi:protein-L-isoaspartate(D-aspartate) O-methyltransferase